MTGYALEASTAKSIAVLPQDAEESAAGPYAPEPHGFAHDVTDRFKSAMDRLAKVVFIAQQSDAQSLAAWPRMRSLKERIDTGLHITNAGKHRGIPLPLMVQLLKSSWHADATWPIQKAGAELEDGRAEAHTEPGPPVRVDPSAHDIAAAYRKRGISVPEPIPHKDDW